MFDIEQASMTVTELQEMETSARGGEIEYAESLGKPIRWFTHDALGDTIKQMLSKTVKAESE